MAHQAKDERLAELLNNLARNYSKMAIVVEQTHALLDQTIAMADAIEGKT